MFEISASHDALEYNNALITARAMDIPTLEMEIDRLNSVVGGSAANELVTLRAYTSILEEKREVLALPEAILELNAQNLQALSAIIEDMLESEYYELVWDTKRLIELFSGISPEAVVPNNGFSELQQAKQRSTNLHAHEVKRLAALIGEVTPNAANSMHAKLKFFLTKRPEELSSYLDMLLTAMRLKLQTVPNQQ